MKYVRVRPWRFWLWMLKDHTPVGIFRNVKGIIPGRWGIYILGLELGSRNPGDPVGLWLRKMGFWPW